MSRVMQRLTVGSNAAVGIVTVYTVPAATKVEVRDVVFLVATVGQRAQIAIEGPLAGDPLVALIDHTPTAIDQLVVHWGGWQVMYPGDRIRVFNVGGATVEWLVTGTLVTPYP